MSTRILAIDTATEACSVALYNSATAAENGETLAHFELCAREHTQRILPMVQQILAEAGLSLNQLDALAFGRGPGSFTGVRIGISVAQGLAFGAELPVLPISTLQTMAQGAYRKTGAERVLAAIDARMGEVYWGEYVRDADGAWHGEASEVVIKPEQLSEQSFALSGRWATVGTGWQTYPQLIDSTAVELNEGNILLPEAEDMLPLALAAWHRGVRVSADQAEPTYLRNEVTWKKLPGR
ncbi:tRNA (adenosine(37)-N6)-threonylcarbamoyltransferase complex dimerization subunit type 1 TsaB [Rouxiella sp. T17]|uniref:tRNA (adenosine(37)-N6)-threonylcarbamoyltransferase complex dimerization subunit type 1 TsaB n=1 Tax=Rouxiella sp. T17 TaxID=3085684 RepID=UPI002FCC4C46